MVEDPNWWVNELHQPQLDGRTPLNTTIDEVIFVALQNAPQIQILNRQPRLQQMVVNESIAKL